MKLKKLGSSQIDVSEICLGTMTWGRQNTQGEAFEQMDYAVAKGVNFFDTAEMYAVPPAAQTYGLTETCIGNWFAARGRRDKIILASKIAGPNMPWVRDGSPISGKTLPLALEDSLKRLQTDYIDLYQLHWPNRGHYHFGQHWNFMPKAVDPIKAKDEIFEAVETLDGFIKAGKIRAYGLSNESAWGTMQFVQLAEKNDLARPVSIQNEYSLTYRLFEPDLAEIALHEQIGLLAYSPLAGGAISGKYLNGKMPEGSRRSIDSRIAHRSGPIADAAYAAYNDLAEKHGLDVCQMAIAFCLSKPFMASVIIGATGMEQLKNNIAAADIELNQDVLAGIAALRRQYPIPY